MRRRETSRKTLWGVVTTTVNKLTLLAFLLAASVSSTDIGRYSLSEDGVYIEPKERLKADAKVLEGLKFELQDTSLNQDRIQEIQELLIDYTYINLENAKPQRSNLLLEPDEVLPFLDSSNVISDTTTSFEINKESKKKHGIKNKKKKGVKKPNSLNYLELTENTGESSRPLPEILYLYDNIVVETKDKDSDSQMSYHNLNEKEFAMEAKKYYVSGSGYDDPKWDKLVTSWDHLQSIKRRLQHPHHPENVDLIFKKEGSPEIARKRLEDAILLNGRGNPEMRTRWNHLGNTWRASGNAFRAIQCFRRALSLWPGDHDVLLNLAVVVNNLGYVSDANVLITEAVRLHPNGALHHFMRGNININLGNREEAIASFRNALRIQPNFATSLQKLRELGADPLESEQGYLDFGASSSWLEQDFYGIPMLVHATLAIGLFIIVILARFANRKRQVDNWETEEAFSNEHTKIGKPTESKARKRGKKNRR